MNHYSNYSGRSSSVVRSSPSRKSCSISSSCQVKRRGSEALKISSKMLFTWLV